MFAAFQQIPCMDPGCTKVTRVFVTSAFVKVTINPSINLLTLCHWVRKAALSFYYQNKFQAFVSPLICHECRDELGHVCRCPWLAVRGLGQASISETWTSRTASSHCNSETAAAAVEVTEGLDDSEPQGHWQSERAKCMTSPKNAWNHSASFYWLQWSLLPSLNE